VHQALFSGYTDELDEMIQMMARQMPELKTGHEMISVERVM
jgi:hypothetical protein